MKTAKALADALRSVQLYDNSERYELRNMFVYQAVFIAKCAGIPAGIRIDPKEPEWPVAFIELPTGQVSWHLEQHVNVWDGHNVTEKYDRVCQFIGQAETAGGT